MEEEIQALAEDPFRSGLASTWTTARLERINGRRKTTTAERSVTAGVAEGLDSSRSAVHTLGCRRRRDLTDERQLTRGQAVKVAPHAAFIWASR